MLKAGSENIGRQGCGGKGKAPAAVVKKYVSVGGSLLKAGSENIGGQGCGEKGKVPATAVKNMFRLAVLCERSFLKMSAGRTAAKKESTAAAVKKYVSVGGSLLKAGSENAGGQGSGEKGKRRGYR